MRKKPPIVTTEKTRCPACGSTEREPYFGTTSHEISGEHQGKPYTHVVWRRTSCKACGQSRVDRAYESR